MSDKISTRLAFGQALAEFGNNPDIFVLDADLACCTMSMYFRDMYPQRFFNIGIAEGNMVGVAAGIATTGKNVFACSFAMFSAGRAWERVRNSVAYPRLNVKIVGTHGGISVGEDGPTHQAIEDIAIMRAIPNMIVVCPSDAVETRETVRALIDYQGPAYLRLGRGPVEVINDNPNYHFDLFKGSVCHPGSDIVIFSTGLMVQESLKASRILHDNGISAEVVNIHTIKPLDRDLIIQEARDKSLVVSAEEHNVIGGLGSAIAELLSSEYPTRILRLGMQDEFASSGKADDLLKYFSLDGQGLATSILECMRLPESHKVQMAEDRKER
jgi:transketolase